MKKVIIVTAMMVVAISLTCCAASKRAEARLRRAACDGDTAEVKQLLARGVNVNATDALGTSPIIFAEACRRHEDLGAGRLELVELLIANGATINQRDGEARTALMYAARNGDTQAVKALLTNGAIVNLVDNNGETALMKAATSSCNEETVRALIDAGADLNARDHKGHNALDSFRSSYACPESKVGDLLEKTTTGDLKR